MVRKTVAVLLVLGILIVGVWFVSSKVNIADLEPAHVAGDAFFEQLKHGQAQASTASYSSALNGLDRWSRFLNGMQTKYGPVTSVALTGSQIIPIEHVPCVFSQYRVARGSVPSNENIIFCQDNASGRQWIVGHQFTRSDINQTASIGIVWTQTNAH